MPDFKSEKFKGKVTDWLIDDVVFKQMMEDNLPIKEIADYFGLEEEIVNHVVDKYKFNKIIDKIKKMSGYCKKIGMLKMASEFDNMLMKKEMERKDERKVTRNNMLDMPTSELLNLADDLDVEIDKNDKGNKENIVDKIWKNIYGGSKMNIKKDVVEKLLKIASNFDEQGMDEEVDAIDGIIAEIAGINEKSMEDIDDIIVEAMDTSKLVKRAQGLTSEGIDQYITMLTQRRDQYTTSIAPMQEQLTKLQAQVEQNQALIEQMNTAIENLNTVKPQIEAAKAAAETATAGGTAGGGTAPAAAGAGGAVAGGAAAAGTATK